MSQATGNDHTSGQAFMLCLDRFFNRGNAFLFRCFEKTARVDHGNGGFSSVRINAVAGFIQHPRDFFTIDLVLCAPEGDDADGVI